MLRTLMRVSFARTAKAEHESMKASPDVGIINPRACISRHSSARYGQTVFVYDGILIVAFYDVFASRSLLITIISKTQKKALVGSTHSRPSLLISVKRGD